MDNYNFKCLKCDHTIRVEAENDDEAVAKIMSEGKEHAKEAHPDMAMSEDEIKNIVKSGMKKEM